MHDVSRQGPLARHCDGPRSYGFPGTGWIGQRDQSNDRVLRSGVTVEEFTDFVKSTYRVLLTRGLRGCYVYFTDTATRDFFIGRTERPAKSVSLAAEDAAPYD